MKKLLIIGLLVGLCTALTSCNMQMLDTTYSFEKAIVNLQNGKSVEGVVESWMDYENSDQLQVKINGKTYLTHASNVVLISE